MERDDHITHTFGWQIDKGKLRKRNEDSLGATKINLGGVYHLYEEPYETLTESWLTGFHGAHHTIDRPADMCLYGVRFKPNGAYPFLGFPLSEVYNQVVTLDTIWGQWASEIREQLHAAPSIKTGLILFKRLIFERFFEDLHAQNIVEYGISVLNAKCMDVPNLTCSTYVFLLPPNLIHIKCGRTILSG